jgi:hypothetical protein
MSSLDDCQSLPAIELSIKVVPTNGAEPDPPTSLNVSDVRRLFSNPSHLIHVLWLHRVLELLTMREVLAWGSTCKHWREFARSQHVWSYLRERDHVTLQLSVDEIRALCDDATDGPEHKELVEDALFALKDRSWTAILRSDGLPILGVIEQKNRGRLQRRDHEHYISPRPEWHRQRYFGHKADAVPVADLAKVGGDEPSVRRRTERLRA